MLTTKKKRFADALMGGDSPKDSAIHAGYSEKTARVKGYQLAKDPEIKSYIERVTSVTFQAEKVTPKVTPKAPKKIGIEPPEKDGPDPIKALGRLLMETIDTDPKLAADIAYKLGMLTVRRPDAMGKKEHKLEAAKKATGRFAQQPPPTLKH